MSILAPGALRAKRIMQMLSQHSILASGLVTILLIIHGEHAAAADAIKHLSQDELKAALEDKDWIVVDTRSTDAFNGWALDGGSRGGHIPGAIDFSANWLDVETKNLTKRLTDVLQTKGITRDKHIALYSDRQQDRFRVADFLQELGYDKLYEFDLKTWIRGIGELKRYSHYHWLVPPAIVKQLVDGKVPRTFENAVRVKFVEVSWGDEEASYAKGHVPGSFHVNTDHFEPPPSWYLGDKALLTKFATDYGFACDDTVVISSSDVTASYRLFVVLRFMGVADVRVLNGGLAAWKRAGYKLETKRHLAPRSESFGVSIPNRPQLIVDSERVVRGLREPDRFILVDTRTWSEFTGKTSGYKYHQHKGRIPGSVYGQASFKGENSLTPYRNVDNTMRNFDEILALWRRAGIDPDKHLCFMCGGGWRAAEVLTFAQVAGKDQTSLYSDGWIGWSNDAKNPIETETIQAE